MQQNEQKLFLQHSNQKAEGFHFRDGQVVPKISQFNTVIVTLSPIQPELTGSV